MREELSRAKYILDSKGYTCVIIKNQEMFHSEERGVKPLLDWMYEGIDLKDAYAADKAVGKAAAFLYVMLGVKAVYAGIVSKPALEIFNEHGIEVFYDGLAEAIRNRSNTGLCPMESAVLNIENPKDALQAIEKTRETLIYGEKID